MSGAAAPAVVSSVVVTATAASAAAKPADTTRRTYTLALIAKTQAGTGNRTTAERLARALRGCGHTVLQYSSEDAQSVQQFHAAVNSNQTNTATRVQAIIGLHAYHAGQHMIPHLNPQSNVRSIIVLGGTDANEMISAPTAAAAAPSTVDTATSAAAHERTAVIIACLRESALIVSFTDAMRQQLIARLTPHFVLQSNGLKWLHDKLVVIPQACAIPTEIRDSKLNAATTTTASGSAAPYDIRSALNIPVSDAIFLLPATIRAVKAPFYLVDAFERWHTGAGGDSGVHLVLAGAILESDHEPNALARLPRVRPVAAPATAAAGAAPYRGVCYAGALSSEQLLRAMCDSTASVNSSESEGMSAAILESMALGVPVLARGNSGNRALITHRRNGYLFDSPQQFIALARSIRAQSKPATPSTVITSGGDAKGKAAVSIASAATATATATATDAETAYNSDCSNVEAVVATAKDDIACHHSVEAEQSAYAALIDRVFS